MTNVEYEQLLFFYKRIDNTLFICRHGPLNDRSDQKVKFNQSYIRKSNLRTTKENVKLHS